MSEKPLHIEEWLEIRKILKDYMFLVQYLQYHKGPVSSSTLSHHQSHLEKMKGFCTMSNLHDEILIQLKEGKKTFNEIRAGLPEYDPNEIGDLLHEMENMDEVTFCIHTGLWSIL